MNIENRLLKNNKTIIGLLFIFYSIISITNGVGNYFRFPFTFVFGFIGSYILIPLLFVIGTILLLNIKISIKLNKKYLLFLISLLFVFPLLTCVFELLHSNYSSFSDGIDLLMIKDVSKPYFSIDNINGGIIGYYLYYVFNNLKLAFILYSILFVLPIIIFIIISIKNNKINKKDSAVKVKNNDTQVNKNISNIEIVNSSVNKEAVDKHKEERFKKNINLFDDEIKKSSNEKTKVIENVISSNNCNENININTQIENKIFNESKEIKEDSKESDDNFLENVIPENFKDLENNKYGIYDSSSYIIPTLDLLDDADNTFIESRNYEIAKEKSLILSNKFKELGLNATIQNFVVGPSITRFEITLAAGVRVSSFMNLQEDFKLALAVNTIRILNPISETIPALGLEIPNIYRSKVTLKEVMKSIPHNKEKLYIPLGKDVSGENIYVALTKMPHALISGSTNSGKSVCLYTLVASLLLQYKPSELKFLLIDPKHVDLAFYDDIPFLLCPVIDEFSKAYVALLKVEKIMNERLDKFKEYAARDFESFNKKMDEIGLEKMNFILVVMDEFATLVDDDKFGHLILNQIDKLVRLGRAAGVHVVLATQRADTTVVNGTIKNNFPARFTFRLSSFADSKTVLDGSGAEKLLNNGDMLLLTPDYSGLRRLQGSLITDSEIYKIVNRVKEQMPTIYDSRFLDLRTEEQKLEEFNQKKAVDSLKEENEEDKIDENIYMQVKVFVINRQQASVASLRSRFSFSNLEAQRYLDRLETDGIIGSKSSSKGREILVKDINDVEN